MWRERLWFSFNTNELVLKVNLKEQLYIFIIVLRKNKKKILIEGNIVLKSRISLDVDSFNIITMELWLINI